MSNVRLPILRELREAREAEPSSPSLPDVEGETLMQVGDLARETGKTVRAIHLYEELELLKPVARSKGRYRLYGQEALVRIRWIGKLQDLGFSLTDIKTIVRDFETEGTNGSASAAMVKVREVYKQKLDETRAQIARLSALEHEILASLTYLEACRSVCEPDRVLHTCQTCDHHSREEKVPDLVAGFRA
ncbi:Mercuric resistance operon regulatory protein [Labilithrix luteola]|uniref:Mercuric resistance operon regulatory protein n=1 Tax=Labilithrix luteola TaxID=1391654 RepID=A0A0K1Q0B2_9BACT|nr:MerR family transcriptional regulator [Labilithrix luteola]AKU99205.1 Mercuric resistance operon regulatory protein [Labilithrix luteola]